MPGTHCPECRKDDRYVPCLKDQSYCRPCKNRYNRERRANKRAGAPSSITPNDSELSDSESSQADAGTRYDALYVMCYDFDPCHTMGLKIGRACDVGARALQLGAGHAFRMHVLSTFPGLGHLEQHVHAILLASSRVTTGRGREWFKTSLDSVLHAIAVSVHGRQ